MERFGPIGEMDRSFDIEYYSSSLFIGVGK